MSDAFNVLQWCHFVHRGECLFLSGVYVYLRQTRGVIAPDVQHIVCMVCFCCRRTWRFLSPESTWLKLHPASPPTSLPDRVCTSESVTTRDTPTFALLSEAASYLFCISPSLSERPTGQVIVFSGWPVAAAATRLSADVSTRHQASCWRQRPTIQYRVTSPVVQLLVIRYPFPPTTTTTHPHHQENFFSSISVAAVGIASVVKEGSGGGWRVGGMGHYVTGQYGLEQLFKFLQHF